MNNIIHSLITEQQNPLTRNIDQLDTQSILELINNEDLKIAGIVLGVIPQISAATDLIINCLSNNGKLFYVGAGTSGRIGVLDASECPPTYGTNPQLVQAIIAGGKPAITEPVEGSEDNEELGMLDIDHHGVCADDVVVGIASSGRTPYVLGAMKRARQIGAEVIGLCNNHDTPMKSYAAIMIEAVVGPEVILGSTRMKAGTAQKMILNMLTTASMIRLGKVYDNLMVDLQPLNEKLIHRSKRIIRMATNAPDPVVNQAFIDSEGHVKTAILMIFTGLNYTAATKLLAEAQGFVRKAMELAKHE